MKFTKYRQAPSLEIQEWINAENEITLEKLKGKIVIIYAFQMLCPGCVQHSIPQSKRLYEKFKNKEIEVLGLHTVFEHNEVMTAEALKVFIDEYQIKYPVGIDLPVEDDYRPATMKKYDMQGTPTLIIIDQEGNLKMKAFGFVEDLDIGLLVGSLINNSKTENNK